MKMLLNGSDRSATDDGERATEARHGPRDERWVDVARPVVAELQGAPGERTFDVRYWNGCVAHGTAETDDSVCLVLTRCCA